MKAVEENNVFGYILIFKLCSWSHLRFKRALFFVTTEHKKVLQSYAFDWLKKDVSYEM